jgi:protease PrsW
MLYIFAVILSLVPSLLLMCFFYKMDYFPEPPKVLWTTFAFGVLITVPAYGIASLLLTQFYLRYMTHCDFLFFAFFRAFICAAMVEETLKFLILYLYSFKHKEFDEPMDGIVYGVAVSLGFATLENILYVTQKGFFVAVVRFFMSVPAHALFGAVMGYFIGQSRYGKNRKTCFLGAITLPIILHGMYNFPLFLIPATENFFAKISLICSVVFLLIFMWGWVLKKVIRLKHAQMDLSKLVNNFLMLSKKT